MIKKICKIKYIDSIHNFVSLFNTAYRTWRCKHHWYTSTSTGEICTAWKPHIPEGYLLLYPLHSIIDHLFCLSSEHSSHGEQHLHSCDGTWHHQESSKDTVSATSVDAAVPCCSHSNSTCLWSLQLGHCLSVQWNLCFPSDFLLPDFVTATVYSSVQEEVSRCTCTHTNGTEC